MVERVRHRKRGTTYEVIGLAELQAAADRAITEGSRLVVYRCETDGRLWCRPPSEFYDGRFEALPAQRVWWPTHYVDETSPEGTPDPSHWVAGKMLGEWLIGPVDVEERRDFGCITCRAGEIVPFTWSETRGTLPIVIAADGSWQACRAIPEDFNHIWEADNFESNGATIDELVRYSLDDDPLAEGDQREIILCFSKWGEDHLRLTVGADGTPCFTVAEAGDAG